MQPIENSATSISICPQHIAGFEATGVHVCDGYIREQLGYSHHAAGP